MTTYNHLKINYSGLVKLTIQLITIKFTYSKYKLIAAFAIPFTAILFLLFFNKYWTVLSFFLFISFIFITYKIINFSKRFAIFYTALNNIGRNSIVKSNIDLTDLGICQDTVNSLTSDANIRKVIPLAEWGLNDSVLSHIGPIPALGKVLENRSEFIAREKNTCELVYYYGRLAIKKQNKTPNRLVNEVIALDALSDFPQFPLALGIEVENLILYRSYMPGIPLSNLLADNGVTIEEQYILFSFIHDSNSVYNLGFSEIDIKELRTKTLNTLSNLLPDAFFTSLLYLLDSFHQKNIAYLDLKYGNLLVHEDLPVIVDFDIAHYFLKRNNEYFSACRKDYKFFKYFFGDWQASARAFR